MYKHTMIKKGKEEEKKCYTRAHRQVVYVVVLKSFLIGFLQALDGLYIDHCWKQDDERL